MKVRYIDLIETTFDFPSEEFELDNTGHLKFHGLDLMELIQEYGTPLKFVYLPVIGHYIRKARSFFKEAMQKHNYNADYHYAYCTKSNHFEYVVREALKSNVHLETSSEYDIPIIQNLAKKGDLPKDRYILCNGYKQTPYIRRIAELINQGHTNVVPIMDNTQELDGFLEATDKNLKIGIRIASEEEPKFEFYTSRLGLRYQDIVRFYKEKIENNERVSLKMLHFFVNTGINDSAYYWSELNKCLKLYKELKKICPELDSLNIGGGFPVKNSLSFDFDYQYITDTIVELIKKNCEEEDIPEPHIFTEFGSFTVGASSGMIYKVIHQKKQNDREKWNMIDSSFMTSLPDSWAISKRFLMLPINKWNNEYERVFLGGLTCDSDDYYNSEQHSNAIFLPKYDSRTPQYIGFFHTGAYQDSIGGFGGIKHCLIPSSKVVLIDKDMGGKVHTSVYADQQSSDSILKILGYV
jgi:arginine decarboxylase